MRRGNLIRFLELLSFYLKLLTELAKDYILKLKKCSRRYLTIKLIAETKTWSCLLDASSRSYITRLIQRNIKKYMKSLVKTLTGKKLRLI